MEAGLTRQAFDLFEQALDMPETDQADWLAHACGGNADLLTEVQKLLRADAVAERAMPTGGLYPDIGPMPARIGRYKIVDRLGAGGMGEVFVGARDDGLFEHVVAIKRVRPSLLPETARALFDRERRALASLSHRCIAQLFDGGVDEAGVPFLIMELVRGSSIDQFASARDLSPCQVVELMIPVCDAVQHAHQNFIVHADLKPANILINGAGDPKIVDFGVARILHEAEAEALYPQTPGYASPQREAGASPTPADDVFALGAVLRALLTGEAPRGSAHTQLTSEAIGKSAVFAAREAGWRQERAKAVHGDLDAIVARACAAKPEERYPAAVALANDLRAWLETRPIAERANDRFYVFQKFLRRRRWRVLGGSLAAVGLVAALAVTATLYTQADHARALAEKRFTEVRSLAKYLLYDVYDRLERTPQTLSMRRDVAKVAQGYLDQLAETPSASADVKREVADGLIRIADLQSGRIQANLGQPELAAQNLHKANGIVLALQKAQPGVANTRLQVRIALRLANIDMNIKQHLNEASRQLKDAGDMIAALPSGDHDTQLVELEYQVEAAVLANWKGAYEDSGAHAAKAIAEAAGMPAELKVSREEQLMLARATDALAEAKYYGGDPKAAAEEYRRLVGLSSAYSQAHTDDMQARRIAIEAHWALGTTLLELNRPQDGLAELDAADSLVPMLLQYQPDDEGAARVARTVRAARAQALAMSGRFDEGVKLLKTEVATREAIYRAKPNQGDPARSYVVSLAMLADLYADHGHAKDACPIYTQADGILSELDKKGVLSQLDRDSTRKMINDQQAKHCK
ncbi:MAG TPA: serine/threonine-protein kinase [Hyphomonadaceae bacterium]|nr:serine/threonine-protein kinase [Hyphomonadaceae bacterium]